jgi:diketogulonate reductase-like aldo/keto reductase
MSIIKRLYNLYLRNTDMVKYARRQGVVVGDHTTISSSVEFPEEPYLIKIGNHVQVTAGVCFYTHGGGVIL